MPESLRTLLAPYPVVVAAPAQWAEMDANRHINNVVYLEWVEASRIAYFEQIGMMDFGKQAIGPILSRVSCKYVYPLTYPDQVWIGTRAVALGADSFLLEAAVFSTRHHRLAALSETDVVCLDYQTRRKAPLPSDLRQRILELEQQTELPWFGRR
ncbi:MAG: thioesterase family protein [Bacteroidia bacterium]